MKKDIRKTLRFSEDEFQHIEKNLNGKTFSDFARDILITGKVKVSRLRKVDPDLLREINHIGVNLNQIARSVNQKEKIYVLTELVEIERHLEEIKNKCM